MIPSPAPKNFERHVQHRLRQCLRFTHRIQTITRYACHIKKRINRKHSTSMRKSSNNVWNLSINPFMRHISRQLATHNITLTCPPFTNLVLTKAAWIGTPVGCYTLTQRKFVYQKSSALSAPYTQPHATQYDDMWEARVVRVSQNTTKTKQTPNHKKKKLNFPRNLTATNTLKRDVLFFLAYGKCHPCRQGA